MVIGLTEIWNVIYLTKDIVQDFTFSLFKFTNWCMRSFVL